MKTYRLTILILAVAVFGCEKAKTTPPDTKTVTNSNDKTNGHTGPVIDLGSVKIGEFDAKATRDAGDIVAGKDAPIDVTVTAANVKVKAVRFWIGLEDANTSSKALASIENPAEPNRWHTHAEVPSSIPDGSKLWVEIEDEAGTKNVGSFDLKK